MDKPCNPNKLKLWWCNSVKLRKSWNWYQANFIFDIKKVNEKLREVLKKLWFSDINIEENKFKQLWWAEYDWTCDYILTARAV